MAALNPISLARRYVNLSNKHDLTATISLFSDDAIYHSVFVGKLYGKAAILEMMGHYFSDVPDVHWQTSNYQQLQPLIVRFNFKMSGISKKTGKLISRSDIEEIGFDSQGLIESVKVGSPILIG